MIVSFHPLAEQELNDAAQYDERESPGLGAASSRKRNAAAIQSLNTPTQARSRRAQSAVDSFGGFLTRCSTRSDRTPFAFLR